MRASRPRAVLEILPMIRLTCRAALFAAALTFAAGAAAQNSERHDGYDVHFNALATASLDATMARQYSIERSPRRGMLVIAVQRPGADGNARGVAATITGEAVNLTGQRQPIVFRDIAGEEVSYIGTFEIKGVDTWTFTLSIQPDGAARAFPLRFNQNLVGG